jgi:predicted RNase H-like nuclease (RuvC/YqgF family)
MSVSEARATAPERQSMMRLEAAVTRALERIRQLEGQLQESHRKSGELDTMLGKITTGDLQPSQMLDRLRALEGENTDLKQRLSAGRERIERLLAKIRFLEEQR